MIAFIAGAVFLAGCTSTTGAKYFESQADPAFDASNYHRAYVRYGDHAGFLKADIDAVFVNSGIVLMNDSDFSKGHDSHDLYVVVTVDKGFTLVPAPAENPDSAYLQPANAKLEIQDAVTKKQLMECVYSRGLFRDATCGECGEILVIELSRFFKDKTKADIDDPGMGISPETAVRPRPPPSAIKNTQFQDFGGLPEAQPSKSTGASSSYNPAFPPAPGRKKQ